MKMKVTRIIFTLIVTILWAYAAFADPYGPGSITSGSGQRANFSTDPKIISAEAGNLTELVFDAGAISSHWQGYYGNITGTITLDDFGGNKLYDWAGTTGFAPSGIVYAANFTVTNWADVFCLNFTGNGMPGQDGINETVIESMYGMAPNAPDGMDETFNLTGNVSIGVRELSNCPATYTYVNNQSQTQYFQELLIQENATGVLIYGTKISQDTVGFDGQYHDFQMIVGANATSPRTYYFYVELS